MRVATMMMIVMTTPAATVQPMITSRDLQAPAKPRLPVLLTGIVLEPYHP